jgi:hypothetical protein
MVDLDHQEEQEGRASKNSNGKENDVAFNSLGSKGKGLQIMAGNLKGSL